MQEFRETLSQLVETSIVKRELEETIKDQTQVIENMREDFESEFAYMEESFNKAINERNSHIKSLNEKITELEKVKKNQKAKIAKSKKTK